MSKVGRAPDHSAGPPRRIFLAPARASRGGGAVASERTGLPVESGIGSPASAAHRRTISIRRLDVGRSCRERAAHSFPAIGRRTLKLESKRHSADRKRTREGWPRRDRLRIGYERAPGSRLERLPALFAGSASVEDTSEKSGIFPDAISASHSSSRGQPTAQVPKSAMYW